MPRTTADDLATIYEGSRKDLIVSLTYHYGCDPASVEDAMQEVCRRFLEKWEHFQWKEYDHVEALFRTAVRNILKNEFRTNGRRRERDQDFWERG